jgi:hypothetical protein
MAQKRPSSRLDPADQGGIWHTMSMAAWIGYLQTMYAITSRGVRRVDW